MNENTNENVNEVKTEAVVEKKKINPFLFINSEKLIDVNIIVFYDDDGNIVSVLNEDLSDVKNTINVLKYVDITFKFLPINYDKINKYRQRSTDYDRNDGTPKINNYKLRDFLLVYHLKDWDIKDEAGNIIKLSFDVNGALSDESVEKVYKLHPSIIDVVMTTYERKMLIG